LKDRWRVLQRKLDAATATGVVEGAAGLGAKAAAAAAVGATAEAPTEIV
jgi:hypothetical protein